MLTSRGTLEADYYKNHNTKTFDEYIEGLETTFEECGPSQLKPDRGSHKYEGDILAKIFGVKLIVYEIGILDNPEDGEDPFWTEETIVGCEDQDAPCIEMGLYPNHYVPIFIR